MLRFVSCELYVFWKSDIRSPLAAAARHEDKSELNSAYVVCFNFNSGCVNSDLNELYKRSMTTEYWGVADALAFDR
ncbi:MAG: hypothetical protein ACKESB_00635 [Candidatus Hodgkinia cicadicola]